MEQSIVLYINWRLDFPLEIDTQILEILCKIETFIVCAYTSH